MENMRMHSLSRIFDLVADVSEEDVVQLPHHNGQPRLCLEISYVTTQDNF